MDYQYNYNQNIKKSSSKSVLKVFGALLSLAFIGLASAGAFFAYQQKKDDDKSAQSTATLQNDVRSLQAKLDQALKDKSELQDQINKAKSESSSSSSSSSSTTDTATAKKISDAESAGYLVIKEWGLKLKQPSANAISYRISTVNGKSRVEFLSAELKTELAKCSSDMFKYGVYLNKASETTLTSTKKTIGTTDYIISASSDTCNTVPATKEVAATNALLTEVGKLEAL